MKQDYVHILTSQKNGTLYIRITDNLQKRVYEHKQELVEGFTKKYKVHMLVHFETHSDVKEAIIREKR